MSFADAVRSVLSKYATFSGRARRSEYWFWVLAYFIASAITSAIDRAMGAAPGKAGLFTTILVVALFLPSLAVAVRRLHDTGRAGAWVLLSLVPLVGPIVLIVWLAQESHGTNAYGPSPKAVGYGGPNLSKTLH